MESELTSAIIKKLLLETMQLPEEVFTTYIMPTSNISKSILMGRLHHSKL